MDAQDRPPFVISGEGGTAPVVLICEHASAYIPPELDGLGLSGEAQKSHIAWDIGALDMAKRLSAQMGAPLISGQISRLVYDCNRPFEASDSIPEQSEVYAVPGNRGLSAADRKARFDSIHTPFHNAVSTVIDRQSALTGGQVAVITLHSFTPIYHGKTRALELGFLCHESGDLAQAATAIEAERGLMKAAVNAPYSASDGVTYSLHKHGEARGLQSVMVEVRNDLIDTRAKAHSIADHLADTLAAAMERVAQRGPA